MSSNSSGTVVRLVILVVVLGVAAGGFVYMQGRKPSYETVAAEISAGALWGEPLQAAKDVFKSEPLQQVPREATDSPSAERWLFKTGGNPPTYYVIFVQAGKITQAQISDENGKILPR